MQLGATDVGGDASSIGARQEARRCFATAAAALAVLPMRNLLGCEVPELVMQVCKVLCAGNLGNATAPLTGGPLSEAALTEQADGCSGLAVRPKRLGRLPIAA